VRRAAPGLHLAVDGARHDVAGQQIRRALGLRRDAGGALAQPLVGLLLGARRLVGVELRDVVEHDALAVLVAQRPALAAHALGDERAAHARRPHHPRRVKLHELHVHELGPGEVGERLPVAGALPRVRVDAEDAADAARREDDRLGVEDDEAPVLAPVAEGAADALAVGQRRVTVHSMYTCIPQWMPCCWSVRIISRPVRSPTCARRGYL
jgi:hypothetical protein